MQSGVGLVQRKPIQTVKLDAARQTGRREIEATQRQRAAGNVAAEGDQIWPHVNPIDGVELNEEVILVWVTDKTRARARGPFANREDNLALVAPVDDESIARDALCYI